MEENKGKKFKNSFHLRVYDAEVLKSMRELFETGKYESMNELINCALGVGIEKIYLEFGKRKLFSSPRETPEEPETRKIERLDKKIERLRLLQEDMFILMNSIEALTATIFNVQRSKIGGEPVNVELIDSAYLSKLPPAYLEIKENLMARFNRKLVKEQKPE